MHVGVRPVTRTGLAASLLLSAVACAALGAAGPAHAAGALFDDSGAVQVDGSTVVVSAGPVEQLDLRWKLPRPTSAVAVVVPVPDAATIQGAGSATARAAARATAPQRKSVLLRPWVLIRNGGPGDEPQNATSALRASTQQVRVGASALATRGDLAATLRRVEGQMGEPVARASAAAVTRVALPGSRFVVALLQPASGSQLRPGWIGTLRLTVRPGPRSNPTLPAPSGSPSRIDIPLPGGVLGARGTQVVAVTADTTMIAASGDNAAQMVTGADHAGGGRWVTILYGQGGGQVAAVDTIQADEPSEPYVSVEPVLLPDVTLWPWLLASGMMMAVAAAVLVRGARHRRSTIRA